MKPRISRAIAKWLWLPALASSLVACGGAQKTSAGEGGSAPPPPQVLIPKVKVIDRTVSQSAKKDFAAAVAAFRDAEKLGWTEDRCVAIGEKFADIGRSGEKMVEAWFDAGVSYQKCGDGKKAEGFYKRALEVDPAHAPTLANLGEIYWRSGNEGVAAQYFDRAVRADTGIVVTSARNNLALIAYNQMRRTSDASAQKGFEEAALGHLQRALAIDNDNVYAYTMMALVYMEGAEKNRTRLDVARLLLEEGKKRNDRYAPLYNAWGLLHMKRSNVGQALEQFRHAVQLNPNFTEARMNLAQLVLSFRKYDEAEQTFRAVLGTPDVSKETRYDATVGLGVALRGLKKIDEAGKTYDEAIKLAPERGDAYYNMGLLWKDFRTNDPDPKANKLAYIKAKGFFSQYLGKGAGDADKAQEARDYMEDCDKYVAQLDTVLQQMNQAKQPNQK